MTQEDNNNQRRRRIYGLNFGSEEKKLGEKSERDVRFRMSGKPQEPPKKPQIFERPQERQEPERLEKKNPDQNIFFKSTVDFGWGKEIKTTMKKKIKQIVKPLIKFAFLCAVFFTIVFLIWVAWISKDLPDPDKLTDPTREVAQSTKIFDRTGKELLYEIYGDKKRTLVELEDIPEYAVQATIAVEDKKFFEHSGVRWISVLRAAVSSALGFKTGGGGASTLTQQLIKNAITGDEHSYSRKIKEAILATRLEKKYSKNEILKMYFNEIPYGSANYGIEAASQSYFGKSVKDIDLSESAILAAMPKAPSRYLNDFEALKGRRDFILELMIEQGYINQEQADAAKKEEVKLRKAFGSIKAPHFSLYIKELISEQFGEKALETGGLNVVTTLDWHLQQIAQDEVLRGVEAKEKVNKIGNGALVAIEPHKGEVLAMVGSRDFFADPVPAGCTPGKNCMLDPQTNVALRLRQPGSSMKPFIYLASFEKGFTPTTILYDVITNFDTTGATPYIPHNYDGKERGPVTVAEALQLSLNIPAVKMTYLVGVPHVLDFLERFGYSTFKDRSRFGLSIVLGGGEVKLVEHVAAYAALAAEGIYKEPISILKVTNSKGEVLFEQKPREGAQVIDKNFVYTLDSILTNDSLRAPLFGPGSVLTLGDRPVAAKTGTTNDYKDGWLMGYTPSLAAGVWVGNSDNTPMDRAGGSLGAGPIWNGFMKRALAGTPVETFPAAPANDATKPVLNGTLGGGIKVLIDSISGKLATPFTPKEFIIEKIYSQPHTILYYVAKDDPRGGAPTDPTQDSQYNLWETGIIDWVARQQATGVKFDFGEPPTEYDDVHNAALAPTLKVISPTPGEKIITKDLSFVVEASAPRGIAHVKYLLDGTDIFDAKSLPFSMSGHFENLTNGAYTLTVTAYDPVGNLTTVDIPFTVDLAQL